MIVSRTFDRGQITQKALSITAVCTLLETFLSGKTAKRETRWLDSGMETDEQRKAIGEETPTNMRLELCIGTF